MREEVAGGEVLSCSKVVMYEAEWKLMGRISLALLGAITAVNKDCMAYGESKALARSIPSVEKHFGGGRMSRL
jgi:hypothetical protein